jgi:hydroxylamine reductase
MNSTMFCYQCEQTAGCAGCQGLSGVCGKSAAVAKLQDELTGALIASAETLSPETILDGLFATVTNVSFDEAALQALIERANSGHAPYDLSRIWSAGEDLRSLKSLVLFGLRGMAAYARHALALGYGDEALHAFFVKALKALGDDSLTADALLPLALELGAVNLRCMALLDRANTESFGSPVPVKLP